ncbi:phytanoyl-CoA dioxygenase family protein [Thermomonospora cellulosilytica]|uniref:Ectoine hydroxylase-related dioxygenase (Phytanoyl-CoA dioxygenase family) n=1 Tax=Thermomonospora cellulosilytica TaxID=1411118 RepID=A0A7W3MWD5_9ACTN|nr:phytanoyl-CoA dioxygenase family protein [Thermomonospora cellulosilytica]MBA9003145.1 ectoine hydroxylase-related dioxygenase (phytanoyl-CoA dioxygenase family) [Thermomonospora cellulosilytica]
MLDTQELTTPDTLPEEFVTRFREQGFVHVPNVLTTEEIAEFRAEAQRLLTNEDKKTWDMGDGAIALDWVADAHRVSEIMRRLAAHPRVAGIAERLAGGPLRLFKSELLRKEGKAGTTITPPHADRSILPFTSPTGALTAWVPLMDVPVERGCMSYIPGSHTRPEKPEAGPDADEYPLEHWPELVWQPRITVPVREGGVSFHHWRTVHVAGVNETDQPRVALATIYMGADATYVPNPYYRELYAEDPDLGGLDEGAPLQGDRFPLVGTGQG